VEKKSQSKMGPTTLITIIISLVRHLSHPLSLPLVVFSFLAVVLMMEALLVPDLVGPNPMGLNLRGLRITALAATETLLKVMMVNQVTNTHNQIEHSVFLLSNIYIYIYIYIFLLMIRFCLMYICIILRRERMSNLLFSPANPFRFSLSIPSHNDRYIYIYIYIFHHLEGNALNHTYHD
jgi:hypothetical protein